MTPSEIKTIFQSRYSTESWKILLRSVFPGQAFNLKTVERKLSDLKKHEDAKSIAELGIFQVPFDGNLKARIAVYEVELNKGKSVTRNRVGLRNLLQHEVVPGDVDAVLASYYSEGSRDWRLTLISKSVSWDHENNKQEWETQPKRYTFVLGETETITTACQRFDWLLKQRIGDAWLLDIIKAFSVEKISADFFDGYHHLFEKFEAYLVDQTAYFNYFKKFVKDGTEKEKKLETERLIRNFVKKLFGRIVFLYFLQKKGWLGVAKEKAWGEGQRNFMGDLFGKFGKESKFYEKVLAVLFFETLNSERKNELFSVTKTKVPFLNGGLFDKDEIEPTNVIFPHSLFQELFNFFDQYNFTIDENSPEDQDIGIDPEMLGLIFENLLEDNREKGTFYTPKEVVHYMCKESLSAYLKTALKEKATEKEIRQIENFIKFNDLGTPPEVRKFANDIDHALRKVKICDPAIGSGAFPMGMVYEILRIKKEIFGYLKKTKFDYREEKLEIIKHSIYGVDLDKGAVDIARLRFWLSLIVDEEVPSPLPNLDYRIMQGDSLVESFEGIELDYVIERSKSQDNLFEDGRVVYSGQQKAELDRLVDEYFDPVDYLKKRSIRDNIEKIIHDNILSIFEGEDAKLEEKITEVETSKATIRADKNDTPAKKRQKETASTKFEERIKELRDEKKKLKQKLANLEAISKKEEKPYFLWHLFFRDIFGKKTGNEIGFDIVIGNPPYGVDVDKSIQEHYGLGKRDSYGVFMSMALKKLLKPGGYLCFIVSDTWLTISSHFQLRQQILDHHHLQKVIRLHQDCFKATVNSCIVAIQVTDGNKKHISADVKVLAADLTNLSTRKNVAEFRDKLFHLEEYIGSSVPEFAVYQYEQELLDVTNNQPVIVASPNIFRDIFDFKGSELIGVQGLSREIQSYSSSVNGKKISLAKFGATYKKSEGKKIWDNDGLFQIVSGIKTGNNKKYVRYLEVPEKGLDKLNVNQLCEDFEKLTEEERNGGIHSSKCFIPFEMGRSTDTDEGLIPNYHQSATNFYIDWSTESLKSMRAEPHSDLANPEFRFKHRISFSTTGIYAPTFRTAVAPIFVNKASGIFFQSYNEYALMGILCSKAVRYLLKNFINHSVEMEVDDIKELMIPVSLSADKEAKLVDLVSAVMANQRTNLAYNFLANEQKLIDKLVYEFYGFTEFEINEIETWFARRYPKLAKYAFIKPKENLVKEEAKKISAVERVNQLLSQDESRNLEFKSSLRYDLQQKGIPAETLEHSVFKNIAAFLNTEGGTILIGVEDNQNIVGLEQTDFNTFSKDNKRDEFMKHFDNLIQSYFGDHVHHNLRLEFATLEGKTVCIIDVLEKAGNAVFLRQKNKPEEFYIRRFASAKALTVMESVNYIKEHWK
jgi:hypothetical protein